MPAWALALAIVAGVGLVGYVVYRVIETRRLSEHFFDDYEQSLEAAAHTAKPELGEEQVRRAG